METLNKQQIASTLKIITEISAKIKELKMYIQLKEDLMNSLENRITTVRNQPSKKQQLNNLIQQSNYHFDLCECYLNQVQDLEMQKQNEMSKIKLFLEIINDADIYNEKFLNEINLISGKDYEYMIFEYSNGNNNDYNYNPQKLKSEKYIVSKHLKQKLEQYNNKIEVHQFEAFIKKNFSSPYIFDNNVVTLNNLKRHLIEDFNSKVFETFYNNAIEVFNTKQDKYIMLNNLFKIYSYMLENIKE